MQQKQIQKMMVKDKHLVITDGMLDDWLAQNLNLSLESIDHEKINDLPSHIQNRLKKYIV